jgi:hypothetical protein
VLVEEAGQRLLVLTRVIQMVLEEEAGPVVVWLGEIISLLHQEKH